MINASIVKRQIRFIKPAKTSRNVFEHRDIYYVTVRNEKGESGIGECAPLKLLSIDDRPDYESKLHQVTNLINEGEDWRGLLEAQWPSITFGLETAFYDLKNGGKHVIYDCDLIKGASIPINGLIWMNEIDTMRESVDQKVAEGFDVIKLKIGAHDFDAECRLLESVRRAYPPGKISLRLDANGAFDQDDALLQLKELSRFDIHSIEQPIKPGRISDMARICAESPIPVALDEELIGVTENTEQVRMLREINPKYIILKPNLIGGLDASDRWVRMAYELDIDWWATSALESNIGLNAISQWASKHEVSIPQGLGTGSLYENNIASPLTINKGRLHYDHTKSWAKINPESN